MTLQKVGFVSLWNYLFIDLFINFMWKKVTVVQILLNIFWNLCLNLRIYGSYWDYLFKPLIALDRMLNTHIFKRGFRGYSISKPQALLK